MHRLVILASVVMLAASSVNCANSPGSNANILGPSASDGAAIVGANGGHGGGRKPGGGGTSGDSSVALAGVPSFGNTVTFTVHTTATAYPWVTLKCKQNGTVVYQESNGIFPTSLSQEFTLGPTQLWTGGAADCTATLENWDSYSKNGSITALASTSFTTN